MPAAPQEVALVVIAKEPVAGRVKTRLSPELSPTVAAEVACAALLDTLETVAATPAHRHVLVLDGSVDGECGTWLPTEITTRFEVVAQCSGGLDRRLAHAFESVGVPAVLVGMDTPQLTTGHLLAAQQALADGHDAVIGAALDGGFWLLGLARPDGDLIRGVPMSCDDTGALQRARLVDAGLRVSDVERLRDIDHVADLVAVAAEQPDGARLRTLTATLDVSGLSVAARDLAVVR